MLIECRNLCLGYEGKTIVKNLSFSVSKGDYLCIVGENGSGKSTLVKALIGVKKPLSGEIIFSEGLTKKCIGYLPQQSGINREFPATVQEIVLSGCLNIGKFNPFYTKLQKSIAKTNMMRLDVMDIAKKRYGDLSGGQQQRVLVARALCATQEIILLDEPVSGLDPTVTHELYTVIKNLNKEGITVIMVTHDIETSLIYANKVLHIYKDKSFFGDVEHYKKEILINTSKGDDN